MVERISLETALVEIDKIAGVIEHIGFEICEQLANDIREKTEQIRTFAFAQTPAVLEALILAEDVLSRRPFSSEIWSNGMHPQTGITKIRDAIKSLSDTSTDREGWSTRDLLVPNLGWGDKEDERNLPGPSPIREDGK